MVNKKCVSKIRKYSDKFRKNSKSDTFEIVS